MTPWLLLDTAPIPGSKGELGLYQRGEEFSIKIMGGGELMNSRVHGSEIALAELGCGKIVNHAQACVLIGGLGMGFTLAAALRQLGENSQVTVAELVPGVIEWNRGILGELNQHPLRDSRTHIREGDVAKILRTGQHAYDAILLDVDNGPEGLIRQHNDWLYGIDGLNAAYTTLRSKGVLAVWSAGQDRDFMERLRKVGFDTQQVQVRSHGKKGARHIIWLAQKY